MKKLFTYLLCATLFSAVLTGCGAKKEDTAQTDTSGTELTESENSSASEKEEDYLEGLHHVEIEVQDYGTIVLELDADTAPVSVTNFIRLAREGFYDGLTFHRIISGFMIQGGDPKGNGTGGSDQTIKGEFSENGVENDISHVRGVISMARSKDPDSASSQFFIVHEDSLFLDGNYAGFGHVTEGMEIVDSICEDTPVQDSNGTVEKDDQPTITSVKVID
ncbi:peptidyl-prolyl cis-trans isomerase [Lachnospiraceae bacterium]|jgi:peptidyl-prolyl cis-trans isomerase B (cyclophilin B)|nr:peptidylprolyl isomerase [uncultured Schaedlerella sp.]EOS35070.1 hypothetical protein C808_04849 [Lachnospiraceae bacterium M18-1]MCI9154475.1 peptidyl-prolyl cis-trans isomerase [Ruminococcus sp.]NBI60187.1 peptidyl-prolyl cis-trans isomerase [Lachnospiraceae bacterium]